MSATDSNDSQPDSSASQYTVTLNGTSYELNEDVRERIQTRAENEYDENQMFSCWWKVASEHDAEESDIHSTGDPILVIETEGVMVPWERLDQLELDEQTTDAFGEMDAGSNDMKTTDGDDREKERAHFGVTPQEFEELPSPEGEDADKVPAKPESFDEPKMVAFVPKDPDVTHTWGAGKALSPMHNWVEWNVQVRADQPRSDKDDSHDHWESILSMDGCEALEEVEDSDEGDDGDILDKVDEGGSSDDEDVPKRFEEGTAGGGHWNV